MPTPSRDSSLSATGEFDGYMCPEGSWKIYPGLKDAVSRRSIPVMYETQAIDFIQDTETREIKGVWAKQGETVIAIKARRAVVLATGSYTGSPELVKRFSRAGMFIPNYDSPHNTGDGIYMATRAGAQLWGFSSECLDFQDWAIKPASEEVGTGIRYLQPTEEAPGHIIVNKAGVRFMNELVNTRHTRAHMPVFDWDDSALEYINSPFWMVFGQDFMDTQRIGAYGTTPEVDPAYGTVVTFTWNGVLKSYLWSMDNSAELEKGWIVTGETLDELAANMRTTNAFGDEVSVDPEGLKATVEQYNALCESGEDDPLGRPSGSMAPIGDGPYYARRALPGRHVRQRRTAGRHGEPRHQPGRRAHRPSLRGRPGLRHVQRPQLGPQRADRGRPVRPKRRRPGALGVARPEPTHGACSSSPVRLHAHHDMPPAGLPLTLRPAAPERRPPRQAVIGGAPAAGPRL